MSVRLEEVVVMGAWLVCGVCSDKIADVQLLLELRSKDKFSWVIWQLPKSKEKNYDCLRGLTGKQILYRCSGSLLRPNGRTSDLK